MTAQTSAVHIDADSGNLMEITVSDGKTVSQATEFPSREPSVLTGMWSRYLARIFMNNCW